LQDHQEKIQTYLNAQKYNQALQLINKNLKIKFDFDLLNYRAVIYLIQSKYDAALTELNELLKISPNNSNILCNIGIAYNGKKDYTKAITFFNKCLSIDPNLTEAYLNLSESFYQNFDYVLSLETLKKLNLKNANIERSYQLMASCYREINDFENHHKSLLYAAKINPGNFLNYYHLGFSFIWKKEIDLAVKSFQHSFDLNNSYTPCLYQINKIKKFRSDSNFFTTLTSQITNHNLSPDSKAYLQLTLSDIYYEEQNYTNFFKYLHSANKIKNNSISSYQRDNLKLDLIQKFFSFVYDNQIKYDPPDFTPIFILGMPRSGSSIIEQSLSQTDEVYAAGEIPIIHEKFSNLLHSFNPMTFMIDEITAIRNQYLHLLNSFPKKRFVIDKLPLNFFWIGFIHLIFPNAIFIHTQRKKVDTCMSLYRTFFADGVLNFSYKIEHIDSFFSTYLSCMEFWRSFTHINIYDIDYANFINSPSKVLSDLFKNLNLNYSSQFLNFSDSNRPVKNASLLQVQGGIQKFSYPKWDLFQDEINSFLS
jgi:tetratricopeptide (TPR) repeat protein